MSVTFVIDKRHLLAGISLLVLTALVGLALVVPAVSNAQTATYTRSASCAGLDFYPTDSRTEYNNIGPMRAWRTGDGPDGSGVFRCDPGLPTGAIVQHVQFTALMEQVTQTQSVGVSTCALRRSGLTVASATTAQDLASVQFGAAGGIVRLTDSTIANATIDNANWGYWLECTFNDPWPWNLGTPRGGLYGADVMYTITAVKG
jgi:hypothetical protein